MVKRSTRPHRHKDFIERALAHSSEDCLLWPYGLVGNGYGKVVWQGKTLRAHRLVCELVRGPAPTPMHEAAHSCGNPACINHKHLRWATRQENEDDKSYRPTGEAHGCSVLKDHEVATIFLSRLPQRKLARMFGVCQRTVTLIKHGKTWSHLTNELKYFRPSGV